MYLEQPAVEHAPRPRIAPVGDRISVVLPTYGRSSALRANIGSTLALEGVAEIIIVDDGSLDDTAVVCAAIEDDRVRVIRHPHNRGVAAARNTGVRAATSAWILFGEDDCRFPADYALTLLSEARRHDADVVGAPLLNVFGKSGPLEQIAAAAPRTDTFPLDGTSAFPTRALETPFVPARALVRRVVFEKVGFYEGFAVNGYREETDFFVQAVRAGFRCIVTPATYCYQEGFWDGGQHHSSKARYEYWALRNNWRFLRRHGAWLAAEGHISRPSSAQISFIWHRLSDLVRGAARQRVARATARVGERCG